MRIEFISQNKNERINKYEFESSFFLKKYHSMPKPSQFSIAKNNFFLRISRVE